MLLFLIHLFFNTFIFPFSTYEYINRVAIVIVKQTAICKGYLILDLIFNNSNERPYNADANTQVKTDCIVSLRPLSIKSIGTYTIVPKPTAINILCNAILTFFILRLLLKFRFILIFLFVQSLNQCVAQLFRRHLYPMLRRIVFRIIITPLIVIILADFALAVFLTLCTPAEEII